MGENHFAPLPTAVYGVVLLCAALAYWILVNAIIAARGPHSRLGEAVGKKGKLSPLFYLVAIPLAFVHQAIAEALYAPPPSRGSCRSPDRVEVGSLTPLLPRSTSYVMSSSTPPTIPARTL